MWPALFHPQTVMLSMISGINPSILDLFFLEIFFIFGFANHPSIHLFFFSCSWIVGGGGGGGRGERGEEEGPLFISQSPSFEYSFLSSSFFLISRKPCGS